MYRLRFPRFLAWVWVFSLGFEFFFSEENGPFLTSPNFVLATALGESEIKSKFPPATNMLKVNIKICQLAVSKTGKLLNCKIYHTFDADLAVIPWQKNGAIFFVSALTLLDTITFNEGVTFLTLEGCVRRRMKICHQVIWSRQYWPCQFYANHRLN